MLMGNIKFSICFTAYFAEEGGGRGFELPVEDYKCKNILLILDLDSFSIIYNVSVKKAKKFKGIQI